MTEDLINKRDRSPKFPYINLTDAVEKARSIFESARGNAVRLSDMADDWGVSPTSSSTLRYAAALIGYGLLSDEGSGGDRRLRLTERALRLIGDERPGVRERLLEEAALSPILIKEYYQLWGKDRPSDAHAISTLKYDSHFTDRAAKTFLSVFDDALSYIVGTDHRDSTNKTSETDTADNHGASESDPLPPKHKAPDSDESPGKLRMSAGNEGNYDSEEWLRVKVSRDTTVRLFIDNEFSAAKLSRLIRILESQLDIMEDDF